MISNDDLQRLLSEGYRNLTHHYRAAFQALHPHSVESTGSDSMVHLQEHMDTIASLERKVAPLRHEWNQRTEPASDQLRSTIHDATDAIQQLHARINHYLSILHDQRHEMKPDATDWIRTRKTRQAYSAAE